MKQLDQLCPRLTFLTAIETADQSRATTGNRRCRSRNSSFRKQNRFLRGLLLWLSLWVGSLHATAAVLDVTFNPASDGAIIAVAVQPDGRILVGGDFTSLGGKTRNRIGRLNADGTLDGTFNPSITGDIFAAVHTLAVQADGKIVVGGDFDTLGGQSRSRLGRLNATGTLDTSFNPGATGGINPAVYSIDLQADGKILVGGSYANLGGQSRNNIGRLNTNGTPDTFNPGAGDFVESLAVQTDGKILVGGAYTTLAGQPRTRIGRVNADGSLDGTFNPTVSGNGFISVLSLAVQANGKVLMSGDFTQVNGQPRQNLARLENTDAATQSLTYAATTITWLRGGTCPKVVRTTFDHGSNGAAWTSHGAGTRITGGWQKTSASVPAGRTIRVRGFAAGGGRNSWFVETYLGKPEVIDQPASRTNNFGTSASFWVSGGGTEPLGFQWFKNGVPLSDQGNVSGSRSNTLFLSLVSISDQGNYTAVLTNTSGSVTSLVATLKVLDPLITQQPLGTNRSIGGTVTFNVTAVGTPPLVGFGVGVGGN